MDLIQHIDFTTARGKGRENRTSPISSPFRDPRAFERLIFSMKSINILVRHAKSRLLARSQSCPKEAPYFLYHPANTSL